MTDGPLTAENPQKKNADAEQRGEEVSSIEADEIAYEHSAERMDDILHAESAPRTQIQSQKKVQVTDQATQDYVLQKDPIVVEVEKILEDGIGSFYSAMPDDTKIRFKQKGEETASEISEMVRTLHVKFKRLIYLISDWLKTIPGINKFFLEQEAKIKADRIMQLIEERKHDQEKHV